MEPGGGMVRRGWKSEPRVDIPEMGKGEGSTMRRTSKKKKIFLFFSTLNGKLSDFVGLLHDA